MAQSSVPSMQPPAMQSPSVNPMPSAPQMPMGQSNPTFPSQPVTPVSPTATPIIPSQGMSSMGTPPPSQTMPTTEDTSHKGGSGRLVFLLVFILVVIAAIGGYLLFSMYQKSQPQVDALITPAPAQPVASPTASLEEDPMVDELESVSPSDEVEALEQDVEGSNFSTLDEEVSTLEQEL